MKIRRFRLSDTNQIAQLFHDTIRFINSQDYSEKQVKAWAPDDIHFRDWRAACETKITLVAVDNNLILGFAQLEGNGNIDCFFCHKDFQGQGIGRLLLDGIEEEARNRELTQLFLEASITAKPFFKKMGFAVIKKQTVRTRGVDFTNFRMKKEL